MSGTPEYRFRRRYSLAPSDPRFLNATPAEITVDDWADHFFKNPTAHEGHEDEDFDLDKALAAGGDEDEPEAAPTAEEDPDAWETVT